MVPCASSSRVHHGPLPAKWRVIAVIQCTDARKANPHTDNHSACLNYSRPPKLITIRYYRFAYATGVTSLVVIVIMNKWCHFCRQLWILPSGGLRGSQMRAGSPERWLGRHTKARPLTEAGRTQAAKMTSVATTWKNWKQVAMKSTASNHRHDYRRHRRCVSFLFEPLARIVSTWWPDPDRTAT